ncbi:Crp/Fnr family transcriptional regulator [Actinomycetospora aeridis]|uniref:Crp/Fnr family transcriptional regulator n=1 Tax=Actinomycetospora aeridis TaxID=3129231 RepID=A0ABU8N1Q4_9PSEU
MRGLAPHALDDLAGAAVPRRYAPGDTVFRTGDPGDAMFVLLRGAVVSRLSSPAGDVVDLGVASAGQAFGYFELIDPGPRTEDAVALRESRILVLPAAAALRALRSSPETLLALAGDLVRIVRQSNRARAGSTFHPVPRRLAALLLELEHHGDQVRFDGPQTLLAQRLGVARQTLNAALRTLAERGFITVHPGGRGVTLDRPALLAYTR